MRPVAWWLSIVLLSALPVTAHGEGHDQDRPQPPDQPFKMVPEDSGQVQLSFAPLVKRTAPAVVNVYSSKVVSQRSRPLLFNDPFFRHFFGDRFGQFPEFGGRERVQNALGSGVLVSADGTIVTNHHVIEGAEQITVVLADKREFVARIMTRDRKTDLAVLKIDPGGKPLPFLQLRDSDTLEVGDLVLAIGNPFGVGQTVTSGIVSALNRSQVKMADLAFFIQTDAAINPGNSGGALITMDGRLAGINTAIFSRSGGSQGVGFAIPANMVRAVLSGMRDDGRLVRPWLGARGQQVTAEIAHSLGLERPRGVLIGEVMASSPAAAAGLKPGDVVLSVNGQEVNTPKALEFRIATLEIGGRAKLSILRDGHSRDLMLRVMAPPEIGPANARLLTSQSPLKGAKVVDLTPAVAARFDLDGTDRGVLLVEVRRDTPAAHLGFRPRDVILRINNTAVDSVAQLVAVLDNKRLRRWTIFRLRDGQVHPVRVRDTR